MLVVGENANFSDLCDNEKTYYTHIVFKRKRVGLLIHLWL